MTAIATIVLASIALQQPAGGVPAAAAVHPDNLPPAPHLDDGETLWPQEAVDGGKTYIVYAPQFASIVGTACAGRAAFSIAAAGAAADFGSLDFTASVDNDAASGLIEIADIVVTGVRMADPGDSGAATATLQRMLLGMHFTVDRSIALATMEAVATAAAAPAALSRDVPAIRVVDRPAVLLQLDGPPVLRRLEGGVGIALNTPSLLAYDPAGRSWLTRVGSSTWLSAARYEGPYAPCPAPAPAVAAAIDGALPARHGDAAASSVPAPREVPEVVVSTTPLCLVSLSGAPDLAQAADGIYAVRNANCDLFTESSTSSWWLLASGRWFSTTDLVNGPWTRAAPDKLPSGFAQLDPRGTWGNVLAAVPGTPAAIDALYQQQVPHTATLDRAKAKATITTVGGPARLVPIDGTQLRYAANANVPLIACDGAFYACQEAAWFTAGDAAGPWTLCDRVPDAIYAMPASSPVYGTVFVRVVDATAETVTFSYTAGYLGGLVEDGVAVYGTGYSTRGTGATASGGSVAGSDATWGDYVGWPVTYGWWPSMGCAGWTCGSFPGWVDYGLQSAPEWCAAGWWGPGTWYGVSYGLGVDWAGAWHWGYHPWGSQDGNDWWSRHWGGAYRRGWEGAARAANRAAGGGSVDQVSTRWGHAAGVGNDVSAGADGAVHQQRGAATYARTDGGWRRSSSTGKAAPAAASAGAPAGAPAGGFRERDSSPAGAAHARSTSMDDFRPDPNHDFDGSPRGAFARGETNYADRREGLEPASPGAPPQPYSRGGSWNGGGWDRPDRQPTNATYGANGDSYTGWQNGQRGYGATSGYTGARGVVRRPSGGDGYGAFEGGGISSGYTGGLGYQPRGTGLTSGYTGGLGEDNGSTGLRSGYSGGLEGNGMTPGVRSGYSGGGAGLNYSMWGYGMVGGGVPQYTWMGAWPGYPMYGGFGGYGGYGGYYGGYRTGLRGGMPMMRGGMSTMRGGGGGGRR